MLVHMCGIYLFLLYKIGLGVILNSKSSSSCLHLRMTLPYSQSSLHPLQSLKVSICISAHIWFSCSVLVWHPSTNTVLNRQNVVLVGDISRVTMHCKIIGIDSELPGFFGSKMQRNLHLENIYLSKTETVISH